MAGTIKSVTSARARKQRHWESAEAYSKRIAYLDKMRARRPYQRWRKPKRDGVQQEPGAEASEPTESTLPPTKSVVVRTRQQRIQDEVTAVHEHAQAIMAEWEEARASVAKTLASMDNCSTSSNQRLPPPAQLQSSADNHSAPLGNSAIDHFFDAGDIIDEFSHGSGGKFAPVIHAPKPSQTLENLAMDHPVWLESASSCDLKGTRARAFTAAGPVIAVDSVLGRVDKEKKKKSRIEVAEWIVLCMWLAQHRSYYSTPATVRFSTSNRSRLLKLVTEVGFLFSSMANLPMENRDPVIQRICWLAEHAKEKCHPPNAALHDFVSRMVQTYGEGWMGVNRGFFDKHKTPEAIEAYFVSTVGAEIEAGTLSVVDEEEDAHV